MTAVPPESLVTEGVHGLEVRWIFPGQLKAAVPRWFGRFPAAEESCEDTYLLDPQLRGLSVKVRGGGALEVKTYRGSPGVMEVPGRARGRMESWQKWSFPFSPPRPDSADQAGWRTVRKRRRISRFSPASGQTVARAQELGQQPRCDARMRLQVRHNLLVGLLRSLAASGVVRISSLHAGPYAGAVPVEQVEPTPSPCAIPLQRSRKFWADSCMTHRTLVSPWLLKLALQASHWLGSSVLQPAAAGHDPRERAARHPRRPITRDAGGDEARASKIVV